MAYKIIPKTVVVHVSHWHCRYGGEGRYPDTSFKHRGANGAPEVPPVQRPNDVARHFLRKRAKCVLYLQRVSGRVCNWQSSVQWIKKYQTRENIILVKLLLPVLRMWLQSDGPC